MKKQDNVTKKEKIWIRICPRCNNNIKHTYKYSYLKGIKENKLCSVCSKKQTGLNNKGKFKSQECKNIISKKLIDHPSLKGNKERNDKISKKLLGRDVLSWYNRKSFILKKCIVCDKEIKVQQYRINTNHFCSRNCQTNYYHYYKIWKPRFNPKACQIIEEYGKHHGYNFQHALNGGEYYIKELRYFVDGYDKEKNVVIEYYEKHHKNFKKRDLERKNKIIKLLNCKFIELYE